MDRGNGNPVTGGNSGQSGAEGGPGQSSESDNMKLIMEAIVSLREHQRLLEERIGVVPVRATEAGTHQPTVPGDMLTLGRNRNQLGDLLVQYIKFAPEEFCGTSDPERAEEWLQNAEHVLEHVTNDKNTWVGLATYKLRGPSRDWWNAVKKSEGGQINWERFKSLFIEKYVPDAARDKKFSEFMFLTKGDMSVSAYNDKYTRLSRYGLDLIATDEANAKKFVRGLDPDMRKQLAGLRIKTYQDALNRSLDIEKEVEDQNATRVRQLPQQFLPRQEPAKRPMLTTTSGQTYYRPYGQPWQAGSMFRPFSPSTYPSRPNVVRPPTTRPQEQTFRPQGRFVRFQPVRTTGLQNPNPMTCYQCREPGHLKRDCPQLQLANSSSQQGMVYAMVQEDASTSENSQDGDTIYAVLHGDGSATDQVVEGEQVAVEDGVEKGEYYLWIE